MTRLRVDEAVEAAVVASPVAAAVGASPVAVPPRAAASLRAPAEHRPGPAR
ncbi:MAG: hypothetical protein L0099_12865 [Acidobacteria bacterium]|nr:hypothetical protein [Acidobacteriota bacterium]